MDPACAEVRSVFGAECVCFKAEYGMHGMGDDYCMYKADVAGVQFLVIWTWNSECWDVQDSRSDTKSHKQNSRMLLCWSTMRSVAACSMRVHARYRGLWLHSGQGSRARPTPTWTKTQWKMPPPWKRTWRMIPRILRSEFWLLFFESVLFWGALCTWCDVTCFLGFWHDDDDSMTMMVVMMMIVIVRVRVMTDDDAWCMMHDVFLKMSSLVYCCFLALVFWLGWGQSGIGRHLYGLLWCDRCMQSAVVCIRECSDYRPWGG